MNDASGINIHSRRLVDLNTSCDASNDTVAVTQRVDETTTVDKQNMCAEFYACAGKIDEGAVDAFMLNFAWFILLIITSGLNLFVSLLGIKYHATFSQTNPLLLQTSFEDTYQLCNVSQHNTSLNSWADRVLYLTYYQAALSIAFMISSIIETILCERESYFKIKQIFQKLSYSKQNAKRARVPYCSIIFGLATLHVLVTLGFDLSYNCWEERAWFDNDTQHTHESFYFHQGDKLLTFVLLTAFVTMIHLIYSVWLSDGFNSNGPNCNPTCDDCVPKQVYSGLNFLIGLVMILECFGCFMLFLSAPLGKQDHKIGSNFNTQTFLAAVSLDALNSHGDNFIKQHFNGCKWIVDEVEYGKGFKYNKVEFNTLFHNDSMEIDLYCEYFVHDQTKLECSLQKRMIDGSKNAKTKMNSFQLQYPQCKCINCYDQLSGEKENNEIEISPFQSYRFLSNMKVCFDTMYYPNLSAE